MSEANVKQDQALMKKGIPLSGLITKEQATAILKTVWPGAPTVEVFKAAMLCQDYGLHPLMKHVYLIKYDRYEKQADGSRKKVGEDWTTVLGIGATRLIMSRQGSFSYVDDTPRIMSEEEQKKIFGRVDTANIVAITKLRTKSGMEASGYGKYPRDKNPMGTDKGNSVENMAFIRSERSAFGRLFPDAKLPATVDVVDEQYMDTPSGKVSVETGEITEGTLLPEGKVIDAEVVQSTSTIQQSVGQKHTDPTTIKTITELHKALKADFKLEEKEQLAELNISAWSQLAITPEEAYRQVAGVRENK